MLEPSPTPKARVLVVDDDAAVVDWLVEELTDAGYEAVGTTRPADALAPEAARYDLVVSDVEMPELRGLELLERVQARRPGQLVLLITAFGSIDLAVEAVRAGACDFVTKPFRIEVLRLAIERALRERTMRREIVRLREHLSSPTADVVPRSPVMRRLTELAGRAARTDTTVLLTGESGVGKGHLARLVHAQSARAERPFVQVNCAALPAPLVESELFGVRRGAFTDAREDRPGLFARADGGTLFLDEVGELPLESQAKLLQVLETGAVRPVGGAAEVKVDVRIVAATNRPLEEGLRERRFRPDLYYRLNVIRLEIPPLRERPEDLEQLATVLVARHAERLGRDVLGISASALRWILTQPWPGNVRELSNVIERAIALSDHDTLVLEDLASVDAARPVAPPPPPASDEFLTAAAASGVTMAELERAYVRRVVALCQGNKAEAARILGMDRRTIYRKLEEAEPD